jgi:hypothetical protein
MWWWIAMGCLTAAGLALTSAHYRRWRARRARIGRIRETVEAWLSHDPPADVKTSPADEQPGAVPFPPTRNSARCRTRVVLGDTSSLSTTLAPGWRLR